MRKRQSANKTPHVVSRGRDYLRPDEANALIEAAGKVGRQPLRDQCLLRLIYRHGLRASEARNAKWTDFDIMAGSGPKTFHVRRLKGSVDSVHTLDRDEVSALRKRCSATLRRTAGSGWPLVRPEPRHQFIDAVLRPAIHQACDEIGEIDLRIDAIQLTGLDQRRQACPILSAFVRAGAIMPGF